VSRRYRKKAVEVEAVQYRFRRDESVSAVQHGSSIQATFDGLGEIGAMRCAGFVGLGGGSIEVQYLGAIEVAKPGDWIVMSAMRGIHVCEEGTFRATYEPVDQDAKFRVELTREEAERLLKSARTVSPAPDFSPASEIETHESAVQKLAAALQIPDGGEEQVGAGLQSDVEIQVCALLERAGLESAPALLWDAEKQREESAWLKGRDDTLAFVRDELAGHIAKGFEESTASTQQAVPSSPDRDLDRLMSRVDLRSYCEGAISRADLIRRSCAGQGAYDLADGAVAALNDLLGHFDLLADEPTSESKGASK
jgi:hypothetical protein